MTCKAELHIAADGRWERATIVCQLEDDHGGMHQSTFRTGADEEGARDVLIEWRGDDRKVEIEITV